MNTQDYAGHDALELASLVRRGQLAPSELVAAAIAAIEELNPLLNFVASRVDPEVLAEASGRAVEAPFFGVPFLLKAGAHARGQPLSMGSRLLSPFRAEADEEITRRFRRAGLLILGHSTAPEFGNSATTESLLYGPSRNPWDPERSCGGSSGGAAAAVAAGAVPVAMAGDGGGSIRIPAHCCGVFGMKPSRARTPVGPHTQGGVYQPLVQHIVSRSVRDSAAMLDAIHGHEAGALNYPAASNRVGFLEATKRPGRRLRVAFSCHSPSGAAVSSDCVEAVNRTAMLCEELGHQVQARTLEWNWEEFREAFMTVWTANLPWSMASLRATGLMPGPDNLEQSTLACLEFARQLNMEDLGRALSTLNQLSRSVAAFFSGIDVYLTPVCTRSAPALGELDANEQGITALEWFDRGVAGFAPFTPLFNATGQPAMSVPLSWSAMGLPVGVQVVGGCGDERTLFALAAELEQAAPWGHRRPAISVFAPANAQQERSTGMSRASGY